MLAAMRRVEMMDKRPGVCFFNGGAGPGIDTGKDVWPETGAYPDRLYIGDDAVGEMAVMCGWTPPAEVETLRQQVVDLEQQVADLEQRAADLDVAASDLVKQVARYTAAEDAAVKREAAKAAKERAA